MLPVDEIADRYIRPDEGTFPIVLMYVAAEGTYREATWPSASRGLPMADSP
jgi:hypothetical protein